MDAVIIGRDTASLRDMASARDMDMVGDTTRRVASMARASMGPDASIVTEFKPRFGGVFYGLNAGPAHGPIRLALLGNDRVISGLYPGNKRRLQWTGIVSREAGNN